MANRKPGVLITSAILKRCGACAYYRRTFRRRYPNGLRVTSKEAERLANSRLFKDYTRLAAKKLLTEEGWAIFEAQVSKAQSVMRVKSWFQERQYGMSESAMNVVKASILADLLLSEKYRSPEIY